MVGAASRAGSAGGLTLEAWGGLEDVAGEWIAGELVEDEMAGWAHEVVVAWLLAALHAWARDHGARVVGSDARLGVSATKGRKADLVVYLAGAKRPPAQGLIRTPPSIVVEVVSPSPADARRDRIEKLDEYAAFGAQWYWIVDPELRTLEIHELGTDRRYVRALGATSGTVDPVPGCTGFVLDLDALWRDLDAALAEAEEPR